LEGRSYREIAIRQDSTVSAVKTLIHRARRRLAGAVHPALLPFPAGARRLAELLARGPLAAKAGVKGALGMAAQALGAATVTTCILMAAPGTGPGPVIARGLPRRTISTHGASHPHHRRFVRKKSLAALERRTHDEAHHAIAQCVHPTHKPRHYTPGALLYATRHLSTNVIEYTDCPEQLSRALLHSLNHSTRRHRSPHSHKRAARA
jgi:hypothetical protein